MKPYNEKEYNRLCAEFLGWEQGEDGRYWKETPTESSNWYVDEMYFHSDWNWIMEVRRRICELDYVIQFTIHLGGGVDLHWWSFDDLKVSLISTSISEEKEAVVEAIWQFLNWYNEQK